MRLRKWFPSAIVMGRWAACPWAQNASPAGIIKASCTGEKGIGHHSGRPGGCRQEHRRARPGPAAGLPVPGHRRDVPRGDLQGAQRRRRRGGPGGAGPRRRRLPHRAGGDRRRHARALRRAGRDRRDTHRAGDTEHIPPGRSAGRAADTHRAAARLRARTRRRGGRARPGDGGLPGRRREVLPRRVPAGAGAPPAEGQGRSDRSVRCDRLGLVGRGDGADGRPGRAGPPPPDGRAAAG